MFTHAPPKLDGLRALALALILTLLATACGGSDSSPSDVADASSTDIAAAVTPESSESAEEDPVEEDTVEEDTVEEATADHDDADHDHDDADHDHDDADAVEDSAAEESAVEESAGDATSAAVAVANADYLGDYVYIDEDFGTMVTVTVDGDTRTIVSNALPNHETGDFPNAGNPNTISEQDKTWAFTTSPTYVGTPSIAREPGVALNGVKFEPDTAERVNCTSGEEYRIEGLQDTFDLGMDFNNAHVQPTGEYHYHGVSELLVDAYASDEDLVLVGFAADGFLMYYSKSSAYDSSYTLSTDPRSGTDCTYRNNEVIVEGTMPDGTYATDWVYNEGLGELDACNGIMIDGTYAYIVTEEYPFIPRCLMGEYSGAGAPGGGAAGEGAPGEGAEGGAAGGPGAGGPPDLDNAASILGIDRAELEAALGTPPPDFAAAAEALGITEAELQAALFG